ncbi:hypothetical protein [Azospirillum agricola]|uniref:hypothetical protein n=1 Tax=Azospirillum agricola TaxID=1720247 RepID=UPI000A0F00A2|nr:hypothetical protein [Azospirillum agricola]SMH56240.1 hypothetical protein SAMN02982994_4027 [Azospirillum lipoferum]
MSDNEVMKPGEAEVAIERAMNQKPQAMLMREKLQKLLSSDESAKQLVGAIRNMMKQG